MTEGFEMRGNGSMGDEPEMGRDPVEDESAPKKGDGSPTRVEGAPKEGEGAPARDERTPAEGGGPGPDHPAVRILDSWVRLEAALRAALPVCSVQPPTQPTELLAALRINRRIGEGQEASVLELRALRNRVAHQAHEPTAQEAETFEESVRTLVSGLQAGRCL